MIGVSGLEIEPPRFGVVMAGCRTLVIDDVCMGRSLMYRYHSFPSAAESFSDFHNPLHTLVK